AAVGSSRKTTAGSWSRARAFASFCFLPLLKLPSTCARRSHSEKRRREDSVRSARVAASRPYSRPKKSRFAVADSFSYSPGVSVRIPTRERTSSGRSVTSRPSTQARPSVGAISAVSTRTVVVLPAPLGPSSPRTSPRFTSRSTPRLAHSSPKRRPRPVARSITGSGVVMLPSLTERGTIVLVTGPWNHPELTGIGRLPMHSVDHGERLSLDGRWRFQLLRTPNANPGPYWAEADVPSVWTMAGNWDKPHYTNVQMPFEGLPPEIPELDPTGIYEREFEVPAEWAGRRVVLHVGAAESVLLVSLNGDEFGVGKDSHLASEFDLTDRLRPGTNRLTLRVVKWSDATYVEDQDQWWHGGITRSVFLYATQHVYLADVRCTVGLAADLTPGTLDFAVTLGFPGRELPSGWSIEARLDGATDALSTE